MCKNKVSAFSAMIAMLAVLLGMLSVMTPNWTVQTNSGMDPFSSVGNRSCADAVGGTAEEQTAANATSVSGADWLEQACHLPRSPILPWPSTTFSHMCLELIGLNRPL